MNISLFLLLLCQRNRERLLYWRIEHLYNVLQWNPWNICGRSSVMRSLLKEATKNYSAKSANLIETGFEPTAISNKQTPYHTKASMFRSTAMPLILVFVVLLLICSCWWPTNWLANYISILSSTSWLLVAKRLTHYEWLGSLKAEVCLV